MNLQPTPKIALLACSLFEPEIARLMRGAEHFAETRWFEMDLHDRPDQLRAILYQFPLTIGNMGQGVAFA